MAQRTEPDALTMGPKEYAKARSKEVIAQMPPAARKQFEGLMAREGDKLIAEVVREMGLNDDGTEIKLTEKEGLFWVELAAGVPDGRYKSHPWLTAERIAEVMEGKTGTKLTPAEVRTLVKRYRPSGLIEEQGDGFRMVKRPDRANPGYWQALNRAFKVLAAQAKEGK